MSSIEHNRDNVGYGHQHQHQSHGERYDSTMGEQDDVQQTAPSSNTSEFQAEGRPLSAKIEHHHQSHTMLMSNGPPPKPEPTRGPSPLGVVMENRQSSNTVSAATRSDYINSNSPTGGGGGINSVQSSPRPSAGVSVQGQFPPPAQHSSSVPLVPTPSHHQGPMMSVSQPQLSTTPSDTQEFAEPSPPVRANIQQQIQQQQPPMPSAPQVPVTATSSPAPPPQVPQPPLVPPTVHIKPTRREGSNSTPGGPGTTRAARGGAVCLLDFVFVFVFVFLVVSFFFKRSKC